MKPVKEIMQTRNLIRISMIILCFTLFAAMSTEITRAGTAIAGTVKFTCKDTEATIKNLGAASARVGNLNIYIGTTQVTSINQNPIIKAFNATNGRAVYCKTNYERTPVDGRGYGLHWNGTNLYAIFSVDGGSRTALSNFARSNAQAWTRSYGSGGGAKISVIARINPRNGAVMGASFISAVLSPGKSNSLAIKGVSCTNTGNVLVSADSWFNPRRIDGTAMVQTGSGGSPHNYTIELSADLKRVTYASASGWETIGTPSSTVACP
jgi:hypothetical protein